MSTVIGPGISILMPAYNPGGFILEAVGSALGQMCNDDELLIQDGLSSDGSIQHLARTFAQDTRVKIASEQDTGQSNALNRALARASNEIVGWLNADDWYLPGALSWAREQWIADADLDLAYGASALYRDNRMVRKHLPGPFSKQKLIRSGCFLYTGASFFSRTSLERIGGFPEEFDYAMDYELFLRYAEASARTRFTDLELGAFRYHDASKSGSQGLKFAKEVFEIRAARTNGLSARAQNFLHGARHLAVHYSTDLRHSRVYSALRGIKRF